MREKREKFKKAVEKKWDTYEESTSKSYVSYSKDLSSRTIVDFEKGEVTIELIVDEEDPKNDSYDSNSDLDLRLFTTKLKLSSKFLSINPRLLNVLMMLVFQEDVDSNNDDNVNSSFTKRLSKLLKEKGDDGEPILKDQLVDASGKAVETVGNTLGIAGDGTSNSLFNMVRRKWQQITNPNIIAKYSTCGEHLHTRNCYSFGILTCDH